MTQITRPVAGGSASYEPANLRRWTKPDSYFGEVWPDYYSAGVGQSRDSDALERSNFTCMVQALGGESETVIVVREGHWAVGWVEWIAIHATDEKSLRVADEIAEALKDYPVVDEEHLSELEYTEACDYWASMSVCERIEVCKRFHVSIFAARRDEIPDDGNGAIYDYLRS